MPRAQAFSPTAKGAGFTLHTERLGPLPLINHFIERIGLHDILSRHIASDAQCAVSHASALGVLLRSIIVEREPIYRQQETRARLCRRHVRHHRPGDGAPVR